MTEQEWLVSDDPAAMLQVLEGAAVREYVGPRGLGSTAGPLATASARKLRLLACACCREVWPLLADPRSRRAVEVAERFADGLATPAGLRAARIEAGKPPCEVLALRTCPRCLAIAAAAVHVEDFRSIVLPFASPALLRDVFGNPFRPVRLPACDSCQGHGDHLQGWPHPGADACPDCGGTGVDGSRLTRVVLSVARRAYECHDFVALPVIADALEEAGCEEETLLTHLRGWDPCPHSPYTAGGATPHPALCLCGGSGRLLAGPHVRGCWALDLVLGKE